MSESSARERVHNKEGIATVSEAVARVWRLLAERARQEVKMALKSFTHRWQRRHGKWRPLEEQAPWRKMTVSEPVMGGQRVARKENCSGSAVRVASSRRKGIGSEAVANGVGGC